MLNYKSVRSSAPQIRSNPALRNVNPKSGFQKRLTSLLEPTPLPFPTFQILREPSQPTLQQHQYYAWNRPAHLRSQWLVVADGMPLLMVDPRDTSRMSSMRIPFDGVQIQKQGPIVLEGAWDAQDHILWIWDVVVWERSVVWNTLSYSKRWELVKRVVGTILDCGHPMSDAEVKVPTWQSLASLRQIKEFDPATSVEFQPEKPGQRRILYIVQDQGVKFRPQTHHERKMVADKGCAIVEELKQVQVQSQEPELVREQASKSKQRVPSEEKKVRLAKDPHSKLPDTYRLTDSEGTDLGLAAVRSLGMSKELREVLAHHESIVVTVRWYESFQKYEVRQIDN
jgi:hypothetical protein